MSSAKSMSQFDGSKQWTVDWFEDVSLVVRRMHGNRSNRLRRDYCHRQARRIDGRRRFVVPLLLPLGFGDGQQLLGLQPVVTGLSNYVVACDSAWHLNNYDGLRAYLPYVYRELEDYFGACECEECRKGEEGHWVESPYDCWPRPCFSMGTRWWSLDASE